jgi:hypothetical protein
MAEQFSVKEGYVVGYGRLAQEVAGQLSSVIDHVGEARPTTGYDGLMSVLSGPMSTYCDLTAQRISGRGVLLRDLPDELNVLAWRYYTTDVDQYTTYYTRQKQIGPDEFIPITTAVVKPFPNPHPFSPGTEPSLEVPGHEDPDIQGLIDEVGGSINAIDWAVSHVTGWSPVEAIVQPLSGNWTELERASEVLTQVGDGVQQVADNLRSQLGTLGTAWDGGAAIAFETWMESLIEALEIEGPINRLVGQVLPPLAGEFEKAAEFMVSTLKTAVDKIATTIATGWVPFLGWYKVYDTVKTVIHVFDEAKTLIDSLSDTIETAQAVIEAAQDPLGFVEGSVRERLEPYLQGAQNAQDLAALDPTDLTGAPDDYYDPGSDLKRAG